MNRDEILNNLGVALIGYKTDAKLYTNMIDKICDVDLYSLYNVKKQYKKYLDNLSVYVDKGQDDKFKFFFDEFKADFIKDIDAVIFSKENREKSENKYYEN